MILRKYCEQCHRIAVRQRHPRNACPLSDAAGDRRGGEFLLGGRDAVGFAIENILHFAIVLGSINLRVREREREFKGVQY